MMNNDILKPGQSVMLLGKIIETNMTVKRINYQVEIEKIGTFWISHKYLHDMEEKISEFNTKGVEE